MWCFLFFGCCCFFVFFTIHDVTFKISESHYSLTYCSDMGPITKWCWDSNLCLSPHMKSRGLQSMHCYCFLHSLFVAPTSFSQLDIHSSISFSAKHPSLLSSFFTQRTATWGCSSEAVLSPCTSRISRGRPTASTTRWRYLTTSSNCSGCILSTGSEAPIKLGNCLGAELSLHRCFSLRLKNEKS